MFKSFKTQRVKTSATEIHVTWGGNGPPLLLLHGYPQTHLMWHKVAPTLAKDFTVVVPDLRGYGESGKPKTTEDHAPYSKRAMALDQVEVMAALGFKEFFLAGHDRGGRVSHRLAIDHPNAVKKIAVLDIVPTLKVFETVDQRVATSYFHWFFLIQPFDFPEKMIGHDPREYLLSRLGRWGSNIDAFPQAVVDEYVRLFSDSACIHSTCEDYRAAATIDLVHDRADLQNKIKAPLLALWGGNGLVGSAYDPIACWRERAVDVQGFGIDCGHFIPEEKPEETIKALREFFTN
jgi:haloacetate dehalogenase